MGSGATVKTGEPIIVPFPCSSKTLSQGAQRNAFNRAVRFSSSPVIVDLSECKTLNHDDIGLLLECLAQFAARDTNVLLAVSAPANQVVLEVTRISSLVPVFDSVAQAIAHLHNPTQCNSRISVKTIDTQGARQ
jgi:hypothetical protein